MRIHPKSTPQLELANRTLALGGAVHSVTRAWAYPLYERSFDAEPELRNRVFCIMFRGLLDSGWEYRNRIHTHRIQAQKLGSLSCIFYLELFSRMIDLLVDLLGQLTREEAILVAELRNQWLHGHWDEILKDHRTVYFVANGSVVKEKITFEEFEAITRFTAGVDDMIQPLRERFSLYQSYYWIKDLELSEKSFGAALLRDIVLHEKFTEPEVRVTVPDVSARPAVEEFSFCSLWQLRERLESAPTRPDPIVARVAGR